jgi:hypothetical protein
MSKSSWLNDGRREELFLISRRAETSPLANVVAIRFQSSIASPQDTLLPPLLRRSRLTVMRSWQASIRLIKIIFSTSAEQHEQRRTFAEESPTPSGVSRFDTRGAVPISQDNTMIQRKKHYGAQAQTEKRS